MNVYQTLYFQMASASEKALRELERQNFGRARDILISSQQEAEELYLRQTSPEKQAAEKGRWVPVSWSTGDLDAYQTTLELSAKDRSNLFLDVAATLSAAKIRVDSITAKGTPDGFAIVTVLISVRNREELDMVTKKLSSIRDVLGVRRAKG